jgi:hypothetical protein
MPYQRTAKEWADYFAQLPADELIAVPFVWQKEDAEAMLSVVYANISIELSDDEWSWATDAYEDHERFNEDSLETMRDVLTDIVDSRDAKEGK